MKVTLPALAAVLGLSLLATPAFAFSTVTVDASGPDGAAQFRSVNRLMDSKTGPQQQQVDRQGMTNLFQSSDGKMSLRAGFSGQGYSVNNPNAVAAGNRNSFNNSMDNLKP